MVLSPVPDSNFTSVIPFRGVTGKSPRQGAGELSSLSSGSLGSHRRQTRLFSSIIEYSLVVPQKDTQETRHSEGLHRPVTKILRICSLPKHEWLPVQATLVAFSTQ